MVHGVLGIIYCPMLEDELLYCIEKDKDIQRIVLLENEYCGSLKRKMETKGIPFEFLPENAFDSGRVEFDHSIYNIVIKANDLALHSEPKNLRAYIENQVTAIQPYVDSLGMYYGLCGNYGWDLTQWSKDMGYKPCAVFRGLDGKVCDDCVAVAVGGTERYLALEKKYTGMLYLSPAIANNWVDFMMAGESAQSLKNMPKETLEELGIHDQEGFLRWMFEFCGYQNTLKINTGLGDQENFERKFLEVTESLNLKPLVIEDGWVTLYSAEGIYAECKGHLC